MPAKSDPTPGTSSRVSLQGVAETVVTAAPEPPPIAVERPEEEYPDTDGKPMADNTWQATTMHYAGPVLAIHFKGRGFVATDLLVYYGEGDKRARVAPDVMVVLGVDGSHRRNYRIWAEGGRAPDFVLEVVSDLKQEREAMEKRTLYAELGVREYFRYAPLSSRMAGMSRHRLVGEVLREGCWEALPRLGDERIGSEVLSLDLRVKKRGSGGDFRELRFFDPIAGEDLRSYEESMRARKEAELALREEERALEKERQGRIRTERELAKLRARLAKRLAAGACSAPSDGT
ncbi:MAG: Uma2 family endonuclease [Bryobacterales bacterium]|nr:Uma2 family endonuclease [Bryobacterales bacterium]